MKKFLLQSSLLMFLVGSTLVSCHSDLDLSNIDSTSELEMGLALPVGSISATIQNFIGNVPNLYVDSMPGEDQGVIMWAHDYGIKRVYHGEQLLPTSFRSRSTTFRVYDQMEAAGMIGPNGQITADGQPRTLALDFTFKLNGVNSNQDVTRLDSVQVILAQFVSKIDRDNLPLEWEWLDKVELGLGQQVRHQGRLGQRLTVYTKGDADSYGVPFLTEIENFSVDLMKQHYTIGQVPHYWFRGNAVDTIAFKIYLTFTVPPMAAPFPVERDAQFTYSLGMENIDFLAAWGYFKPSNKMRDESTEDLSGEWGDLGFLKNAHTPFAKPHIDVDIITEVAGALELYGDYLYSIDRDGKRHYATFRKPDGTVVTSRRFTKDDYGSYLDPYTSTPGDVTKDMVLLFDETPEHGHLDSMFLYMPDSISYKFHVQIDDSITPQARLTKNDTIEAVAHCKLPLIFNQGLFVNYSDTIRDINIGQFSIDSLVKDVSVIDTIKATDVKLILKAQNNIQFCIRAAFRCLDENNQVIEDPENPGQPFLLFPEDTIRISAPTFQLVSNKWTPVAPGETVITAAMTKEKLAVFPKIRSIRYTIIVDDESIQEAFRKGLTNIKIKATDALKLKIGLTAHAEAVLNFDNTEKK